MRAAISVRDVYVVHNLCDKVSLVKGLKGAKMKNLIFITIVFSCLSCFCEDKTENVVFLDKKPFYTAEDFPQSQIEVAKFSNIAEKEAKTEKAIIVSSENWEKLCENIVGKRLIWQATVQSAENVGQNAVINTRTLLYRHISSSCWDHVNQCPYGISIKIRLVSDFAELRKGIYDGIPRKKEYKEVRGFMQKENTLVEKNKPGAYIKRGTMMGFVAEVKSAKVVQGEKTLHWTKPDCGEGLLFNSDLTIEIEAVAIKWGWHNKNPQIKTDLEKIPYPDVSGWISKENEEVKRLEMVKKTQNK
jgi:hypothetical protein